MKELLKQSLLLRKVKNYFLFLNSKKIINEWEMRGKPAPPPHIIKQKNLQYYAKKHNLNILVETGTYYGDMIAALKNDFKHIYSIEFSKNLYEKAIYRFKSIKSIYLIHGDSAHEIGKLLKKINEPALFWLDAHYSAGITEKSNNDTPILDELNHILSSNVDKHVIIIDDARCFGSDPAYPTINELHDYIKSKKQNVTISIKDDSIIITHEK
tara:strand:+ start:18 stop:653 length:636 start_codon:yes stop_codon:yes gene_type:complete